MPRWDLQAPVYQVSCGVLMQDSDAAFCHDRHNVILSYMLVQLSQLNESISMSLAVYHTADSV
jgi:hypothetical protein